MKILILISLAVAATSAAYLGPQHIPVIGPNGVPVEPHEVQAARANHLAAVASAYGGGAVSYYAPYAVAPVQALGHNALPLDTPEVAAAKVQHYRDFAAAAHRNGVYAPLPAIAAPVLAGPYPIDTPEVQLAKAAHFQAHAEASARAGAHYRRRRDVYGGYHVPVIGPNGVPVETPEVQAARASHLAALAEASSRSGASPYYDNSGAYDAGRYSEPYHRYYGPPATIGPDGQPVETPEVKAAKAYHFAAHNAVRSGAYLAGPGHYY
ncbi:cuticle protein 18.7-like [Sitophilus oryzae]|uniref:Cuticle protein 18.7-like n=1 Tax=Sitophilus oryzae TaxID=7048 RepID=A0A6J2XSB7_SITOR|nr:cuticle protein 18.7-like [Sitophilus oryzae]